MSSPPGVPPHRPRRSGVFSCVRGGLKGGSFMRSSAQLLAPGSFGASRGYKAWLADGIGTSVQAATNAAVANMRPTTRFLT